MNTKQSDRSFPAGPLAARHWPLAVVVLLFVAADILFRFMRDAGNGVVAVFVGLLFAQVAVVTAVSVLAARGAWWKPAIGAVLLCVFAYILSTGDDMDFVGSVVFGQAGMVAAPLLTRRFFTGWVLSACPGGNNVEAIPGRFSLRQLLITVTLVAVALGIGQAVLPTRLGGELGSGELFQLLAIFIVIGGLASLVLVSAALAQQRLLLWAALAICTCAALSHAQSYGLRLVLLIDLKTWCWAQLAAQGVGIWIALYTLRWCGFRMVKHTIPSENGCD